MTVQVTEKGIQERAEKIIRLRKSIAGLEKLHDVKSDPAWKHLTEILESTIKVNERRLENINFGDRQFGTAEDMRLEVREAATTIKTLESVVRMVNRPEDEIAHLNSLIKGLEAEIKDAQEKGA